MTSKLTSKEIQNQIDKFLANGGAISQVPEHMKAKKKRKNYSDVTICVAKTTTIHYNDGAKVTVSDNPLSKKERYSQQREIAKDKGNHSTPKYWRN